MQLYACGMDANGQWHIAGPTDVLKTGGVVSTSGTPSLAAGAALGTGAATPTIVGNNYAGHITFTTAGISLAAGTVLTMTFADGLTYPNGAFITFSAGNDNFSAILSMLYVDAAVSTPTSLVLKARLALSLSTTYRGFYQIIGY